MKYADVKKLFETLAEFDPSNLEGIYDDERMETLYLSYKDVMNGLNDYLKFWDITLNIKEA